MKVSTIKMIQYHFYGFVRLLSISFAVSELLLGWCSFPELSLCFPCSLWNELNQECCSGGSCNFYSNSNSNCQNSVSLSCRNSLWDTHKRYPSFSQWPIRIITLTHFLFVLLEPTQVNQALYLIQDIGLNLYNLYEQCYGGAPMNAGRYAADLSNLFRDSGFTFKPQVSDQPCSWKRRRRRRRKQISIHLCQYFPSLNLSHVLPLSHSILLW